MEKLHLPEGFAEKFEELGVLYKEVKENIILAENLINRYPLAPINEVRNSYDHLFRCIGANPTDYNSEFESAKRHLKRAGYDACEIIVSTLIEEISEMLKEFDSEAIKTAIPNYYPEIKQAISDCQSKFLVNTRLNKNSKIDLAQDEKPVEFYKEFHEITYQLLEYRDTISKAVPALVEYKRKNKKKELRLAIKAIIIGLVIGLPGYIFGLFDRNHIGQGEVNKKIIVDDSLSNSVDELNIQDSI